MRESIGGIIVDEDLTFIRIFNLPDEPDWAGSALEEFCFYGQTINFIAENVDAKGRANLSVCLSSGNPQDFAKAVAVINDLHEDIYTRVIEDVCLVTVYGPHFKERCGLAATFFRTLGIRGINILAISTSISSISAIINKRALEETQQALGEVFEVP